MDGLSGSLCAIVGRGTVASRTIDFAPENLYIGLMAKKLEPKNKAVKRINAKRVAVLTNSEPKPIPHDPELDTPLAKNPIMMKGNDRPLWMNYNNLSMDSAAKELACIGFAEKGTYANAARRAGVTTRTLKEHLEKDPMFAHMLFEAYEDFRDTVEGAIFNRAIEGYKVPIYSHKTGQLLGHETRYSDQLTSMLAKRHIKEYREQSTVDLNVHGGVLVVGAAPAKEEDWEGSHQQPRDLVLKGDEYVIKDISEIDEK